MNVELFVHGVPMGAGFWAKGDDERAFFSTFYNDSLFDENKLLVQVRKLDGKPYCYYSYMVCKDVVSFEGRKGSYFGLTLRFEGYCKDIIRTFKILDDMYSVYVLGTVLKQNETVLKYEVHDFESVGKQLESMREMTYRLVIDAFSDDSFVSLDDFSLSDGTYSTFNLYDCDNDSLMSWMKKCGQIAVSPYYPSKKEAVIAKQYEAKIQDVQQQYEKRLQDVSQSLRDGYSGKQDAELRRKDDEIKLLNKKIYALEAEMGKLKSAGRQLPSGNVGVSSNLESEWWIRLMRTFLPVLNLIILLVVLFRMPSLPSGEMKKMVNKVDSIQSIIKEKLNIGASAGYESFTFEPELELGMLIEGKKYKVEYEDDDNNGVYQYVFKGMYGNIIKESQMKKLDFQVPRDALSMTIKYCDEDGEVQDSIFVSVK